MHGCLSKQYFHKYWEFLVNDSLVNLKRIQRWPYSKVIEISNQTISKHAKEETPPLKKKKKQNHKKEV